MQHPQRNLARTNLYPIAPGFRAGFSDHMAVSDANARRRCGDDAFTEIIDASHLDNSNPLEPHARRSVWGKEWGYDTVRWACVGFQAPLKNSAACNVVELHRIASQLRRKYYEFAALTN